MTVAFMLPFGMALMWVGIGALGWLICALSPPWLRRILEFRLWG